MDEEINGSPAVLEGGETGIQAGVVHDIDVDEEIGAERGREGLDPLAESLALVAEGKLGTFGMKRFGNPPRDGAVIRDPHHQAALARHQIRHRVTRQTG